VCGLGDLCPASARLAAEQEEHHAEVARWNRADNAEAHINLGAILLRRGQIDEAVRMFAGVVSDDPGQILTRYHLALAFVSRRDLGAAAAELEATGRAGADRTRARASSGRLQERESHQTSPRSSNTLSPSRRWL
jgi:predicted Zn-dependent protease